MLYFRGENLLRLEAFLQFRPLIILSMMGLLGCVAKTESTLLKSSDANIIPFTLVSSSPQDGSLTVGVEDEITLVFSHNFLSSTIQYNSSTNSCSGTVQLSSDDFASCVPLYLVPGTSLSGTTVHLKPFGGFVVGNTYKIKITTGVQDTSSRSLSSATNYSSGIYVAGDLSYPSIISRSPANLQTEVDVNPSLTVVFSEPVDASKLTATGTTTCSGNIQLSQNGFSSCIPLQTPVTLLYGGAGFSIQPFATLDPGITYQMKLLNGIVDNSGKAISAVTSSFTTAAIRTVRLNWTSSPSTLVHKSGGGYRVYYSTVKDFSIDHYSVQSVTVPYVSGSLAPNSVDIDFPHKGTWYFRVSAFSTENPVGSAASDAVTLEVQ